MVRHLTVQGRIFLCKSYFKNNSTSCAGREFIETYCNAVPPSRSTIQRLLNKFETIGTVLDKKHSQTQMVLTEEKLNETGDNLEHSPQKSLIKFAQQTNVFSVFSKKCNRIW